MAQAVIADASGRAPLGEAVRARLKNQKDHLARKIPSRKTVVCLLLLCLRAKPL